ncbi:hypothetical protein [Variovorax sp. LjRoot178]|uniref:hypothetical protein n=1 Tax=Variovorax sp. LjRoot178 TaxID=3342277 RepID=UPI003ED14C2B
MIALNGQRFGFDINHFAKRLLVEGLHQIDQTLNYCEDIKPLEEKRRGTLPWLA